MGKRVRPKPAKPSPREKLDAVLSRTPSLVVGPVSEDQRRVQVLTALEELRAGHGRGDRAKVWTLSDAVIFDACLRCIVRMEPVGDVFDSLRPALGKAGVTDKRFGEFIRRVRDRAFAIERARLLTVNSDAELKPLGDDLDQVMAFIARPMAARLHERLKDTAYNRKKGSFQHLTMRMFEALSAAAEVQRKNRSRDAEFQKIRASLEKARDMAKAGKVKPEDIERLFEAVWEGRALDA